VAPDPFCGTVHNDVGAELDGLDEEASAAKGVIDD
jgi:hypothetical protein